MDGESRDFLGCSCCNEFLPSAFRIFVLGLCGQERGLSLAGQARVLALPRSLVHLSNANMVDCSTNEMDHNLHVLVSSA